MKRAVILVLVAGCPSPSGNPSQLWLAPDQNETHVTLIDHEPPPF